MRLAEVISKAENLRPSEYDKTELTGWLNEVEFMAVDQVINKASGYDIRYRMYDYELDAETELLIPDQFINTYVTYIFSKIDYNNAEIERYNLDAAAFEAEWQAYAAWFRREHMPKRLRDKNKFLITPEEAKNESDRVKWNLIGREF